MENSTKNILDKILEYLWTVLKEPMIQIIIKYFSYVMNYEAIIKHLKESTQDDSKSTELLVPSIASAILISMYGECEYHLNELCKSFEKDKQLNIRLEEIYGTGIERAVTYLEKVVGIKGIKQSKEWSRIKNWNVIRNSLVHNNGILNKEKDVNSAKWLKLSFNKDFLEADIKKLQISLDNCTEFGALSGQFFQICIGNTENLN